MTEQTNPEEALSLISQLESILFVASGPVSTYRLATVLETTQTTVHNLLASLEEEYQERGIRLQWSDNAVQLTTAPAASTR
jgi:chromosome segregation and condensation protein ScpB